MTQLHSGRSDTLLSMYLNLESMEYWEFGALGIHNPETSTLAPFFKLVSQEEPNPGDILELGVLRGASLITTSFILESISSSKLVYGLDTFTGFPGYTEEDSFEQFFKLKESGLITQEHLDKAMKNKTWIRIRGATESPASISNSADFSDTSIKLVENKIKQLGLDKRAYVRQIDITTNLKDFLTDKTFSLVLVDVDLFLPYLRALPLLYKHLSPGGVIYLDEYYSLKFPGPRLAVHQFLATEPGAHLESVGNWLDFERWIIRKSA